MTYRITFTTAAARQVRKLPRSAGERILQLIDGLAEEPRPHGARKLVGEEIAWRVRAGDYRVIYEVLDDELLGARVRTGLLTHRRRAGGQSAAPSHG